jgi:hypothetical protein
MARVIPPLVLKMVEEASSAAASEVSPFWLSDSEGVPEEGMYQLAFELDVKNTEQLLGKLPLGYRIVFTIFNWEHSRAGEGFKTGIENVGEDLVESAATCYEAVDMAEEALALRQMLERYRESPLDYEQIQAGYDAITNPYRDDWNRIPLLVRHLSRHADKYFCIEA